VRHAEDHRLDAALHRGVDELLHAHDEHLVRARARARVRVRVRDRVRVQVRVQVRVSSCPR